MKNWKLNLIIIIVMATGMMSCDKQLMRVLDVANSESDVQMTTSTQNVNEDVDAVSFNNKGIKASILQGRLPQGATLTDSGADTYPRTLTLDFGEGTTDRKKCIKKGTIIVTLTDDMATVGAVRTVTFKDFSTKGRQITGTKTMKTLSISDQGQPTFELEANLKMVDKKGNTTTKMMTGTSTWEAGFGDEDMKNDVFFLKGTASMQRNEQAFTRTIVKALKIDRSCDFILEGIVELNKNGAISSIDFGDGTCDELAILTKDGETFEIDLEEERVDKDKKGKCDKDDDGTTVATNS